MGKTKSPVGQTLRAFEYRLLNMEASMYAFAVRQRALEELMEERKLMAEDAFNARCEALAAADRRMMEEARDASAGRDPGDAAGGDAPGPRLVGAAPTVAGGDDPQRVSV